MVAVTVEPQVAADLTRPRTREYMTRVIGVVFVLDALVLSLAVPIAISLRFGVGNWRPEGIQWLTGVPLVDFGWVVPLWVLSLTVVDAYSRRQFARGSDEVKTLLRGSLLAALSASMLAYLVNLDMSRGYFLCVFIIGTMLLLGERYLVGQAVARMRNTDRLVHRVVAVGGAAEISALRAVLDKRRDLGYRLVGVCVPNGTQSDSLSVPVLGGIGDAVAACTALSADTLLVAGGTTTSSSDLRRIGWDLAGNQVDLVVVPSLLDVAGPRIHLRPVSGLPFMHIEPPQVDRAMRWGKAVFDRSFGLILVILAMPLMIAVAAAVRLETGGPVFFRHRRVGCAGQEFGVLKFRSMDADAEERHEDLVRTTGQAATLFKLTADPRVTRVGRFIRRYSLDELPQLFNVLAGTMSLVGPRPQVPAEVAQYDDSAHRRLLVRPGITGLWQVSGRSDLTWDESVRLDLYYIDNWSMTGDLVILARTVRAVLRATGAY